MSELPSFHMTPDEFRKWGYAVIDWIADYQQRVEQLPVLSSAKPGQVRSMLPPQAPEHGEPFQKILQDVDRVIMPGITHWQSPNFFAYFPANSSGPAILGELLSAGLGIQGMLWATSPAATELETHVLDWLVQMLDLPKHFHSDTEGGVVIQDTASGSTLCALLAAREVATGFLTRQSGLSSKLVAYASNQAHSSLDKAMIIAGLGTDNLRHVPVDADFKMIPEQLERMIQEDLKAGFKPVFVQATVGTTSSNAIDPVGEIGGIAKRHGLWLHVDAAMSGTAAICPEFRHIHDGLEFADSYTFNPHKWMFTNFDCNCFFI